MAFLADILRTATEYALVPFDLLPEFWGLTLFSIITGVIMLWIVGKITPQRRLEIARDRVASAIYEMRLFLDSPRRVVASQGRMLAWLGAYLVYLMPAFILLSFPLGLFYLHLDVRHGQDPLPIDESIVLRADLTPSTDGNALIATPAAGVAITAPPLYDRERQRVYLRVEIDQPGEHMLTLQIGDNPAVTKILSANPDALEVHPDRASGLDTWLSYGDESPLPEASGIAVITLPHPARPQSWLTLPMPWWIYWLIVSTIFALLLRRPMGVVL